MHEGHEGHEGPDAARVVEKREPLRRRARALALKGLVRAPEPLVAGALWTAAGLARWSRYERATLDNLALALGAETSPGERARIARGVRRHAARILAEWLRLAASDARAGGAWIDELVELDPSAERLVALAADARAGARGGQGGQGLLIATAHLGNWELRAAALRRRGLDGAVVGRHRRNDSSSTWLVKMRRGLGIATLAQDEPPRRMLEILRRGATLGILCDLEVRRLDGRFVPFFGRPALTMTAPAALARAARASIYPVRCVARGARYVMSADAPLALRPELDRDRAQELLLLELNAVFERWIREDPEQWAWHQPRWRTSPAAEGPGIIPAGGCADTRRAAGGRPAPRTPPATGSGSP
jgi:KDO2-lipid IV(A) lauroyltransferase